MPQRRRQPTRALQTKCKTQRQDVVLPLSPSSHALARVLPREKSLARIISAEDDQICRVGRNIEEQRHASQLSACWQPGIGGEVAGTARSRSAEAINVIHRCGPVEVGHAALRILDHKEAIRNRGRRSPNIAYRHQHNQIATTRWPTAAVAARRDVR